MNIKSKLLAVALLAGGTMFAETRFSIGVGVGAPAYVAPASYAAQYVPACPGPGYTWVNGYWTPQGGRNVWIAGFWRPPVGRVYHVAPRYDNSRWGYARGFRR